MYPRNSDVWCESMTSAGGRVVKKIKTKPPVKRNRTQVILAKVRDVYDNIEAGRTNTVVNKIIFLNRNC